MNIKYRDPYKDDKYGKLTGDKSEAYFGVNFSEAVVHKTENAYIIAGYATDYKSVIRSFKPEQGLNPGLVALPIYGAEYEVRSKDSKGEWQSTKVQPSTFEKQLYTDISTDEDAWMPRNAAITLAFTHIPNGMADNMDAMDLTATIVKNVTLSQVDLSGKLPEYTPPKAYSGGKGGGKSYGMSPQQRLDFLKKQLQADILSPMHKESDSLPELITQIFVEQAESPGTAETYFDALFCCVR